MAPDGVRYYARGSIYVTIGPYTTGDTSANYYEFNRPRPPTLRPVRRRRAPAPARDRHTTHRVAAFAAAGRLVSARPRLTSAPDPARAASAPPRPIPAPHRRPATGWVPRARARRPRRRV